VDDIVTIGRWKVPEGRLWALAGMLGLFTGLPALSAALWLALLDGNETGLLGPVILVVFLAATWAVRSSPSAIVMRAWALLAWGAVAGPGLLLLFLIGGVLIPHDTPVEVVGAIGFVAVLAFSAALGVLAYATSRRWFGPRLLRPVGQSAT
jgi:hypothetical protein